MTTTNTHTSSTELHALRITGEQIEHVAINTADTVTAIQQAVGCRNFDVVNLDHDIDLFVDDEGLINGSELNLFLTIIAHALGRPAAIFGNAVALSIDPDTGDSLSLTPEQQGRIIGVLATKPDAALIDQVCDTLAPIPAAAAILRSMF